MDSKTQDLRRKIREIETENEQLQAKLSRASRHLMRLRLERRFLLEKFQELYPEYNTKVDDNAIAVHK